MTLVASFPPVASSAYLDRLEALPDRPALPADFWADVHQEIQSHLQPLESNVRRCVPEVRVRSGRTSGERFALFSYRTFSLPDTALDPVVVGITLTLTNQGVNMDADASGEECGDYIWSVPSETVAVSSVELLRSARASAQRLCDSANAIAMALRDPSRRLE